MAFTQEKLDVLEDAIARGVTEVQYDGERIKYYSSVGEMLRLRSMMQREIAGRAAKRVVFGTDRGLR